MKRVSYLPFFFGLWSILLSFPGLLVLINYNRALLIYGIIFVFVGTCISSIIGLWMTRHYVFSYTDQLTGVFNRRYFDVIIKKELTKFKKKKDYLSIAIIDIDHFKETNDKYGHDKGDYILVELTKLLSNNSRKTDSIIRWGGDEFLVILPGINNIEAEKYAERLRLLISNTAEFCNLSICVGIATTVNELEHDVIIKEADKALYQAKIARNNIVCTII